MNAKLLKCNDQLRKMMEEANKSGEVKTIPIFSKDTELLVFRAVTPCREEDRDRMSEEYTEKIGIKCVVIDARTELVAVQNG